MIRRRVVVLAEARADLRDIRKWIERAGSPKTAVGYVERIKRYIAKFDIASERGSARDDILPGLRIVGFEERISIAMKVDDDTVVILRVFSGGQDWERALRDSDPDEDD